MSGHITFNLCRTTDREPGIEGAQHGKHTAWGRERDVWEIDVASLQDVLDMLPTVNGGKRTLTGEIIISDERDEPPHNRSSGPHDFTIELYDNYRE